MPFVQLKLGDLFDEPSDLIVLPCSTGGTVTRFVATRLREYNIPRPRPRMRLGNVDIQPFYGAENLAQYVAFAASVQGQSSSTEAITNIGVRLGEVTREYQAVRRVSAPLLGAGAGGLRSEDVVNALGSGFKETASRDAVLTIFVLHKNVLDRLRGRTRQPTESSDSERPTTPQSVPSRVFVSYSGTSPSHEQWVVDLATFLRANGLDARLDQWHLRRGMDLPQWMVNELQLADRVIIVSDSRYTERADGRVGGVGWETMLIQGDMSNRPVGDNRYLVIVREDELSSGVPIYLKTKFSIHWPLDADDEKLKADLLKELYNVQKAPPIGEPPVFV